MRNRLTCAFWLASLILGPLPALAADPAPIEITVV
jgi:hypothetical protein